MRFLSPAEDFQERTLASLTNAFERLAYLESLYDGAAGAGFHHWGMERVHGPENARNAIRDSYRKETAALLARDLQGLWLDWHPVAAGLVTHPSARTELPRLRARHLSLVIETLEALEAAHSRTSAA